MVVIVPAILPRTREDLADKLLRLEGIATDVQIDVVDGRFASPATWPYAHTDDPAHQADASLPFVGSLRVEMDVMAESPEADLSRWVNAGASRITIHAEASHRLPKLFQEFRTLYGHDTTFAPGLLSLGLALNLKTDISLIEPYLSECDYVQFMGIREIGKQGQAFDTSVLMKIAAFTKKYPDMPVQVDGGVSLQTAPALLSAGVSRLVVGSGIWQASDLGEAYDAFTSLTTQYGLYT